MKRSCIALLLVLALLCGFCGCGNKSTPADGAPDLKVGVLFADNADASGVSHYHLLGLQKAVEDLKMPEPLCKYNVTDASFDPSEPVTAAKPEPTETTAPAEPESYTTEDGEVIVRAVPIAQEEPETGVAAAADLIGQGCNVIVATDPIYDDLTAYLAQSFKKVTFLQYRGTHTDLKNLQSFSDNLYEAFYLAGAVAGCEGVKQIGFTARTGDGDETDCINAFALGAAETNPDAAVTVRMLHTDFDLYLERTIPEELVVKDKCALLAQTVYTALPLTVAAVSDNEAKRVPLPCIGFGYDMQADGGERYLCSVVYDFSVYFSAALQSIANKSFDASPYTGGVREGIVGLSELQHATDKAKQELQSLKSAFDQDTLHPLEGFTPEKNGFAANVTVR